jgi:uncharacterized protein YwqG
MTYRTRVSALIVIILLIALSGCSKPSTQLAQPQFNYPPMAKANATFPEPDPIHNKKEFMKVVAGSGLSKDSKTISALFRNAIEIDATVSGANLKPGESKIGGMPDLPKGSKWPDYKGKPLPFIAQFRMVDVAKYDKETLLPKTGMLYFFYDAQEQPFGYDISDKGKWKVIYYAGKSGLVTMKPPVLLPAEYQFRQCNLSFTCKDTFPSADTPFIQNLTIKSELKDLIYAWGQESDIGGYQLLGYPAEVQNEMYSECQLVTNGINCGGSEGYNDPRVESLLKGATDWQLLLQVSSDETEGRMWGDDGYIYFWITKDDLKKRDFSKVWLILQCG